MDMKKNELLEVLLDVCKSLRRVEVYDIKTIEREMLIHIRKVAMDLTYEYRSDVKGD